MDISSWQNTISLSENFQINIKMIIEKTIKLQIINDNKLDRITILIQISYLWFYVDRHNKK